MNHHRLISAAVFRSVFVFLVAFAALEFSPSLFAQEADLLALPVALYGTGSSNAHSVAMGDLRGNGARDIVISTAAGKSIGPTVKVLLSKGDGTFLPPVSYRAESIGAVAIADVNGDGIPDIVLAYGPVAVFLGNGDGSYRPEILSGGGEAGESVAVADVNGDGRADVVIYTGNGVKVQLGNGDGTFQSPVFYPLSGIGAGVVAIADINGDSKPDVILATRCATNCSDSGPGAGGVFVLLNNGDGTFHAAARYGSGLSGTVAVTVADVNHDGKADIITAGCTLPACSLIDGYGSGASVLYGNGNGTFRSAVQYNAEHSAQSVAAENTVRALLQAGKVPATTASEGDYRKVGSLGNLNSEPEVIRGMRGKVRDSENGCPTQTILTGQSTSYVHQDVAFTVQLDAPGFCDGVVGLVCTGEMTLYEGGTVVGTGSVSGNACEVTISTPALTEGTHRFTAVYGGSVYWLQSTSNPILEVVSGYPTATTLATSLNPSTYGQPVTLTATVSPTGANLEPPTGNVQFWSQGSLFAVVPINSAGVATLTKPILNADPYQFTAIYGGDSLNATSTSAVLNQTVQQATSSATITSSVNPSAAGQAVKFTAKITSPTVVPSGPVTFTAGSTTLGSVELKNGSATLTTSTLPSGTTTVTVTYPWNSDVASSSASVAQTVQ